MPVEATSWIPVSSAMRAMKRMSRRASITVAAHELQLARDVLERLVEQPPPGVRILGLGELAADLGARGLGGHELTQLVETQVEQVAQPDQLLQPLDVRLRVQPPLALLALLG